MREYEQQAEFKEGRHRERARGRERERERERGREGGREREREREKEIPIASFAELTHQSLRPVEPKFCKQLHAWPLCCGPN